MMVLLRKWTILTHRYLGIPLSLLFVVWFGSGIAIMYSRGMPSLTRETRLERLPSLDFSRVHLSPSEAGQAAVMAVNPGRAILLTIMERPAYRFSTSSPVTVFADTGDLFSEMNVSDALYIASIFMKISPDDDLEWAIEHVGVLTEVDQWTIAERDKLPLHKVRINDPARTELYISEGTGEVTVMTTRGSRALAWVAAIPHWFYFAPLRLNGPLWSQVIIWSAAAGCLMAILGIVVGILQFRPTRPFRLTRLLSYIPYSGLMKWHYVTGIVFGVFTLTWVFSGLLSVDPWGWANDGGLEVGRLQETFQGGTLDLSLFPRTDSEEWSSILGDHDIKEVEFLRIQGAAYYTAFDGSGEDILLSAAPLKIRTEPFSSELLLAQLHNAYGDAAIIESKLLEEYDSYYYQRGSVPRLPVLRVKFDDPDNTWLYVDPARSRLMSRITTRGRLDRWIYNGLHSLDFAFWYNRRPLWDIGMIALCLGGLSTSLIGMYFGFRRLGRGIFRRE